MSALVKKLLAILSVVLFANQASADENVCMVNSKLKYWFGGYQAEQIIIQGSILSSGRKLDVNGNEIPETVWYHVMLTGKQLAQATIDGLPHLECISRGIYICTVGLGYRDNVYYECKTYTK